MVLSVAVSILFVKPTLLTKGHLPRHTKYLPAFAADVSLLEIVRQLMGIGDVISKTVNTTIIQDSFASASSE